MILITLFVNIKSVQTRIHIQTNANNFVNVVFIILNKSEKYLYGLLYSKLTFLQKINHIFQIVTHQKKLEIHINIINIHVQIFIK